MSLRDKIIASLTALGITTGVTVVGLDQACVFDAEVVRIETEKVCFETPAKYKKFKDDRVALSKANIPVFLWTQEGIEFLAVIEHEEKKYHKKVKLSNSSISLNP